MKTRSAIRATLSVTLLIAVLVSTAVTYADKTHGRPHTDGVIYVISQGLYYDTFGTADPLPNEGPFQKLYPGVPTPATLYGPGDPGYVGGRWWIDVNEDGERDEGDHFFACPLLGPGRPTP